MSLASCQRLQIIYVYDQKKAIRITVVMLLIETLLAAAGWLLVVPSVGWVAIRVLDVRPCAEQLRRAT